MLRRASRAGSLDDRRVGQALHDLMAFPAERVPSTAMVPRIWELREDLTPYVALAEALGAVLLTADARLSRAPGPTCAVEVLTSP